jgi:methionyl-tRNA formyltransferase
MKYEKVTLVCEKDSWILPYVRELLALLSQEGIYVTIINEYNDLKHGCVAVFLGCTKLCPNTLLTKNKLNLLVHESDLPKGRGFAPISWSILNNESQITFSLVEAAKDVDGGMIYDQIVVPLRGNELCAELRHIQGLSTIEICHRFLTSNKNVKPRPQSGQPSYYRRRTPKDSELDVEKSIAEQFNLFRIVDNYRYPAFFRFKGRKFKLTITDEGLDNDA